jgi:hypothetical protein
MCLYAIPDKTQGTQLVSNCVPCVFQYKKLHYVLKGTVVNLADSRLGKFV